MSIFAKHIILSCHSNPTTTTAPSTHHHNHAPPECIPTTTRRWTFAASAALMFTIRCPAMAETMTIQDSPSWGTHSLIKEKYFMPGLTPEQAAERIKQTAESMRTLRPMLERLAWRFVMYYIRIKESLLDMDLKTAYNAVPEGRRAAYVLAANELVDNMTEFDEYVRSPKVYESYLFYEKTLKSFDDVVAFFS